MTEGVPSKDEIRETLRGLLQRSKLASVNFLSVAMERKDAPSPAESEQFPVAIGLGMQPTPEGAAYRVDIGVERPDISVSVSVVAVYQSETPDDFQQFSVAQAFGEMVALPAAYPFARAKLQELTIDTGVPPVFLGILDVTRIALSTNGAGVTTDAPPSEDEAG